MASGAKQSTLRTEETNSQSPPKKDKRGSQSCTPQKKMTVVSKQLIKINPTSKISNMNLRRISMSKRNLDQKSRQSDLVN